MPLPQSITELFAELFKSQTIKPSYKKPHILYTIMLLGDYNEKDKGIGRYKLKQETGLGGGSIKTLVGRLKEQGLIEVYKKKQKGHFLTQKGEKIYKDLVQYLPLPRELDNPENKYVLGEHAFYTKLKKSHISDEKSIGIQQRDASIKIGGSGATCVQKNKKNFVFPDNPSKESSVINIQGIEGENLNKGDYVVIGGAEVPETAIISTIAASLTLLS